MTVRVIADKQKYTVRLRTHLDEHHIYVAIDVRNDATLQQRLLHPFRTSYRTFASVPIIRHGKNLKGTMHNLFLDMARWLAGSYAFDHRTVDHRYINLPPVQDRPYTLAEFDEWYVAWCAEVLS